MTRHAWLGADGELVERPGPVRLAPKGASKPSECAECGASGVALVTFERFDRRGFVALCGTCVRELLARRREGA